jgi:uncharacterized protein (DUF1697 family)
MTRYVAFLRGINVAGHQNVKMTDLRLRIADLGFDNVSTFRASGNIRFDTTAANSDRVRAQMERELGAMFGGPVEVLMRSAPELEEIVRLDPFSNPSHRGATPYVTFVAKPIRGLPLLPVLSPKSDVEVFLARGRDVFSWGLQTPDHHHGFPNLFVERLVKQPATTRNWSTVTGVVSRPSGVG